MFTTEWDWDKEKRMSREDGKAEGIAEGKKKGIIETAKKMLLRGLGIDEIADITDLDRETVMKLANAK